MVIAVPLLAAVLALPTGLLFGIGYGNGVRIGYEQIYPILFPSDNLGKGKRADSVRGVVTKMNMINRIYDAVGGKEANKMGIAVGLNAAMSEIDKNPDFQDLLQLEYELSGNTPSNYVRSRYGLDNISSSGQDYSETHEGFHEGDLGAGAAAAALQAKKDKFRLAMENLTDAKLKEFYKNRNQGQYNSWQKQILVLVHRLRFGKIVEEGIDEGDKPEIINYAGTNVKTLTFHYQSKLNAGKNWKQVTQVYRFNFPGHMRKARSVFGLANNNTGFRRETYHNLVNKYTQVIQQAYPNLDASIGRQGRL